MYLLFLALYHLMRRFTDMIHKKFSIALTMDWYGIGRPQACSIRKTTSFILYFFSNESFTAMSLF